MATQNNFSRTFGVNAAMSAYYRVAVSTNGKIGLADLNVRGEGVLQADVTSDTWQNPTVRFWGTGSCQVFATGGPVTPGDTIYSAAGGQVRPSLITGGLILGRALTGVSGAVNGVFEMLPENAL